ncbi:hypothetical protein A2690_03265 [Candidatus Roizmanbacteria bacterium RIFCSPHIGHO2_01_FULL_39_12b]|uniref:VanZ-like domain-containing protein n=1 Tax=Candidatus Roizmanbacteria bacterium RIFCSPHIGHO2_01_FULL_39_12b TaxID=1802030 RepID=A0A1F7GCL9_9BACT|nr:MAG: hypothetical protein A2690_03265 [Candidatus Roizmanbacteria bacterium RIFCSPHIGHO2_01_FULL_39_12b]OGK46684.1 MAG: hypothetical protein A3B46_02520 [Candidatus Roizmanbacteria bacterium RIFCSPLOWO2_01_FULL_39_19]
MKSLSIRSFLYWMPAIVWMVFIFVLSSRQRIAVSDEPLFNFLIFKTLHVIEYAILYTLSIIALKKNASRNAILYGTYITIIYALTDELHQTNVPTREGIFRDVLIDSAGVAVGIFLINQLQRKFKLK